MNVLRAARWSFCLLGLLVGCTSSATVLSRPDASTHDAYTGVHGADDDTGAPMDDAGGADVDAASSGIDAAVLVDASSPPHDAAFADDAFVCITPDADGDGFSSFDCGGNDCDDTIAAIHVGADEVCNGADDDCDEAIDEGCGMAPPRPLAPLSTATVTSRRPRLRWSLTAGTDGAHVEICADRACTSPIASFDATGSSAVPTSDLPEGVVFWRLQSRVGTDTSGAISPTWQFIVGARTAPIDTSWGTTLDVDGDGYADLAVGAFGDNRVYIYRGGPSGIGTTPTTTITGAAGGSFGFAVSSAGDVDGDGYADLLVSAYMVAGQTGRAYVYFGGPHGLSTTPSIEIPGAAGSASNFGWAVAGAGDLNGDGYADVVIGAPLLFAPPDMGRVFIYFGGPSGPSTTPTTTLIGRDGGPGEQTWFGQALASAGDVNGDGYADLAVGAWAAFLGDGGAYVYLGGPTGVSTAPSTTIRGPTGGAFGMAISSAGDVDGDGYADVAVGATWVNGNSGETYLYRGGPSGLATTAATSLAGMTGPNWQFGAAISSAGDINRDGYSDVFVGTGCGTAAASSAYLFLGGPSGLGPPGCCTGWSTWLVGPDAASACFGGTVAGIGDTNRDGYPDLAVGAELYGGHAGRTYVFLGSSSGVGPSATTTLDTPAGTNGQFSQGLAGGV